MNLDAAAAPSVSSTMEGEWSHSSFGSFSLCRSGRGRLCARRLPTAGSHAKPFHHPSAVMKASACPPLSKCWWVARGCCAALSDSSSHLSGCSAGPHHCGFSSACSAVLETECKSAGKLLSGFLYFLTLWQANFPAPSWTWWRCCTHQGYDCRKKLKSGSLKGIFGTITLLVLHPYPFSVEPIYKSAVVKVQPRRNWTPNNTSTTSYIIIKLGFDFSMCALFWLLHLCDLQSITLLQK